MAEKKKAATGKRGRGNARNQNTLSPEFRQYAQLATERLREICDDEETPVKLRADLEKWFVEMWFGKSPQTLESKVENVGTQVIRFEGELEEWSR